jgi:hypothetical protein
MAPAARGQAVSSIQGMQEIGGLVGRIALAALALVIVSRRRLLRLFLIPGLVITPVVFVFTATHSLNMFRAGIFLAGFTTVAQLTFWGNYLPRLSGTLARNRRGIRGQRRRSHARHIRLLHDQSPGGRDARRFACC